MKFQNLIDASRIVAYTIFNLTFHQQNDKHINSINKNNNFGQKFFPFDDKLRHYCHSTMDCRVKYNYGKTKDFISSLIFKRFKSQNENKKNIWMSFENSNPLHTIYTYTDQKYFSTLPGCGYICFEYQHCAKPNGYIQ